jgi:hypothetical protein
MLANWLTATISESVNRILISLMRFSMVFVLFVVEKKPQVATQGAVKVRLERLLHGENQHTYPVCQRV